MRESRISLTEEDFKTLVTGGVVRREGAGVPVAICLQDIGLSRMSQIVDHAHERPLIRQAVPEVETI